MIRLGFDATPLLGQRTGIGNYVSALADRLAEIGRQPGIEVTATAFSRAGRPALAAQLPPGVLARGRPVPAALLHRLWGKSQQPNLRFLAGRLDLFHATNFVLPPLGAAAGVLTVHDLSFLRYPDTVSTASARYADLVPRGVRRAAVVCTLTHAVAAEVAAEYGLDADRIVVTPPGVGEEWFRAVPLTALELAGIGVPARAVNGGYLVAVGTVEPRKNLPLLIDAQRALVAQDPASPTLILAGPAGWGPELGLSPADRVVLTGYLPLPVLMGLVAGARGLVFPSRYEGFGLPPLEALACGVPVIVTDLAVTQEVLGPHARYVADGDRDGLAAAMAALGVASGAPVAAAAPVAGGAGVAAADMARRERRDWARQWTWRRCTDAILAAYGQALGVPVAMPRA